MLPLFLQNRLFRHCFFWIVVIFFSSLGFINSPVLQSNEQFAKLFWVNLFFEYLPTYLVFTYSLLFIVVPVLLQKKYLIGSLAFAGVGLLSVLMQKLFSEIDIIFIQPVLFGLNSEISFSFSAVWGDLGNPKDWVPFSYDFILVGFVAAGIKFTQALISKQAENQRLKQENIATELELMKAQINSDFLFNTLTNLYQLTLQKSPESPQVVLRLANLMSYMLYESQAKEVPLEREVEMIQHYVSLAETHRKNTIDIALNISGDITGKMITPLLLLPFIENAFVPPEGLEQGWVSIQLSVKDNLLKFRMAKGLTSSANEAYERVNKRLQYLYPDRYKLMLIAEEEMLFVKLDLELTECQIDKLQPNDEISLLIS